MSRPWLSVVMPTYNGAAYLPAALESIASQGADGVEVVAVDDGSTDETRAILARYADRLDLRVEARGRVGNWVANSNHGLRLARAEHACFLHQDDLWLPGRLRALRHLLSGSATLVLNPACFIDDRGRALGPWRCPLRPGLNEPAQLVPRLLVQNFIAIPAPVFARAEALATGGLDERLWYTADWDFWLRLAARGPTVYHPEPLTAFRVHGGSQTIQGAARTADLRAQLDLVLDRHLPAWRRPSVESAARLSVQVNHTLAALASGRRPSWVGLARGAVGLGWEGWRRFLRDTRLGERVLARLRARLVRFA